MVVLTEMGIMVVNGQQHQAVAGRVGAIMGIRTMVAARLPEAMVATITRITKTAIAAASKEVGVAAQAPLRGGLVVGTPRISSKLLLPVITTGDRKKIKQKTVERESPCEIKQD